MNSGNQLKSLKLCSSHAAVKLAKFPSTLTVNHSSPERMSSEPPALLGVFMEAVICQTGNYKTCNVAINIYRDWGITVETSFLLNGIVY